MEGNPRLHSRFRKFSNKLIGVGNGLSIFPHLARNQLRQEVAATALTAKSDVCTWPDSEVLESTDDFRFPEYAGLASTSPARID